jgi:hypothetical protein
MGSVRVPDFIATAEFYDEVEDTLFNAMSVWMDTPLRHFVYNLTDQVFDSMNYLYLSLHPMEYKNAPADPGE